MKISHQFKVIILNASWLFLLTQPILIPFFNLRGVDLSEVFIIQTVQSVAFLIFSFPVNYLADRFSMKKILIFASILRFIGAIVFFYSHGLYSFSFSYFLIGIANSAFAGISIAMLYQSSKEKRKLLFVKKYKYSQIAAISSLLIGGFIAAKSVELVVFLNIITSTAPLIIAISIKENKVKKIKTAKEEDSRQKKSKSMLFVLHVALSSLYSSIPIIILYYGQTVFISMSMPVYYYSVIIFISQIIIITASKHMKNILKNHMTIYLTSSVLILLLFLALSLNSITSFFIAMLLTEVVRMISQTYISHYINEIYKSNYRSSINAISRAISIAIVMVIGPIIGYLIPHYGSHIVSIYLGTLLTLISLLIVFFIYFKENKKEVYNA